MSQNQPARPDLMGEMRFRIPLPIVIPVAAMVAIGLLAVGMSKILLSIEKEAATIVALAVAANILGGCAYYALRPRMSHASVIELVAVVMYPVIIGVAIAQLGFGGGGEEAHGAPPAAAGGGFTSSVVASGVAFDVSTIKLEAEAEATIEFENQDSGTVHNIAIYEDESAGKAIFDGKDITGPASTTYGFTAPPEGEYFFQCDIHPDMNGTVESTTASAE